MAMDYLRDSILATLAYYDIFDFPLTLLELHKYLINPGRVAKLTMEGVGEIKLADIQSELEYLAESGRVQTKNGFYFLLSGRALFGTRIIREKIFAQKRSMLVNLCRYFAFVPYIRGIWVSGSMATANTTADSDFDLMVVARAGRLYTARMLLSLTASVLRSRRKRYEESAPDKFCFNHYLADNALEIRHRSLYTAQAYINLKPLINRENLSDKFFSANSWLYKFVIHGAAGDILTRGLKPSHLAELIAKTGERVLGGFLGDMLEHVFKKYQQKRIKENPMTYETGGRVVFSDNELEFHPRSFEAVVIDRKSTRLEMLGILAPAREADSGLLT